MQIEGSRGEKESGEIRIFSKGFPFIHGGPRAITYQQRKKNLFHCYFWWLRNLLNTMI